MNRDYSPINASHYGRHIHEEVRTSGCVRSLKMREPNSDVPLGQVELIPLQYDISTLNIGGQNFFFRSEELRPDIDPIYQHNVLYAQLTVETLEAPLTVKVETTHGSRETRGDTEGKAMFIVTGTFEANGITNRVRLGTSFSGQLTDIETMAQYTDIHNARPFDFLIAGAGTRAGIGRIFEESPRFERGKKAHTVFVTLEEGIYKIKTADDQRQVAATGSPTILWHGDVPYPKSPMFPHAAIQTEGDFLSIAGPRTEWRVPLEPALALNRWPNPYEPGQNYEEAFGYAMDTYAELIHRSQIEEHIVHLLQDK